MGAMSRKGGTGTSPPMTNGRYTRGGSGAVTVMNTSGRVRATPTGAGGGTIIQAPPGVSSRSTSSRGSKILGARGSCATTSCSGRGSARRFTCISCTIQGGVWFTIETRGGGSGLGLWGIGRGNTGGAAC